MAVKFKDTININGQYTLPEQDGTVDQVLSTDGAGVISFVDLPDGEAVKIACKNTTASTITKGTPVYITGTVGASFIVQIAPADAANSAKMPAVGLLETDLVANGEGFIVTGGLLKNLTTDPIDGTTPSSNDTIYVKSGGGLTMTKPTGSNLIQNIGKVGRVNSSNAGSIVVSSILRTNDVPNLTEGKIWVGSVNNTEESTVVHIDETNTRIGINQNTPDVTLDITGTDAIQIPKGTDAERPTPESGMFRFNTTSSEFEGYNGTEWAPVGGANTASIDIDNFTGDGTTVNFTLTSEILEEDNTQVYIDGVYQSKSNYTTSGTTLTFSTAPPTGTAIEVVNFTGIQESQMDGSGTANYVTKWLDSDTLTDSIITDDGSTVTVNGDAIVTGDLTVDTNTLYVDSTNNRVGIGTDLPQVELDIASGAPQIRLTDTDGGYCEVVNASGNLLLHADKGNTQSSSYMRFEVDAIERMRIESGGDISFRDTSNNEAFYWDASTARLGIGVGASPAYPLDISGSRIRLKSTTGNAPLLDIESWDTGSFYFGVDNPSNTGFGFGANARNIYSTGNYDLVISTNSTEAIRVAASSVTYFTRATKYLLINPNYGGSNTHVQLQADSGMALAFATNGDNERMRIDSSGRVGINQTSPSSFFYNASQLVIGDGSTSRGMTIYGSSSGDSQIFFADGTTGDQAYRGIFRYEHSSDSMVVFTSATERMRIDSYGNITATNSANNLVLGNAASGGVYIGGGNSNTTLISLQTGSSEKMRINSAGNIGIGTTSPIAYSNRTTLAIEDAWGGVLDIMVSGVSHAQFGTDNFSSGLSCRVESKDGIVFKPSNTEKMRIDSSGRVGIGMTPSNYTGYSLQLNGGTQCFMSFGNSTTGTGALNGLVIGNDSTGADIYQREAQPLRFHTDDTERMRITSGGYLKVGRPTATETRHLMNTSANGNTVLDLEHDTSLSNQPYGLNIDFRNVSPDNNTNWFHRGEDSTAIRFYIYSDGDVWTSDAGTLTSDETLKNNITDATPKLDDVMNLRVRNYYWNEDYHPEKTDKKLIGFIAQEFEQVFPHLVSEHIVKDEEVAEDGTVIQEAVYKKGIKEGKLIPILVKAMQEQQEIINDLKARIETLENQ